MSTLSKERYMNKQKTIVFGGAFNPPTIAHEDILKECVDYAGRLGADVWLMPSNSRSDKRILVSLNRRIKYINAMIQDVDNMSVNIEINKHELQKQGLIKTIDTVMEFERLHPDRDFEWVFGSDSTQTMGDWEGGDWLLNNLETLIVMRPGSDINPQLRYVRKIYVQERDISSTELRRRIECGEAFEDMVGGAVRQVLNKNTPPF